MKLIHQILTRWNCSSSKSVSHTIQDCNGSNPRGESIHRDTKHFDFTPQCNVRDVLHWPGAFRYVATEENQLLTHHPDAHDLRKRLATNLRVFCPSINCLHSVCETHGMLRSFCMVYFFSLGILFKGQMHTDDHIPSGKPQMTGKDMILSEGVPCGPHCFRLIQDFERFIVSAVVAWLMIIT